MNKQERINFYLGTLVSERIENIKLNSDIKIKWQHVNSGLYVPELKKILIKTGHYGKKLNYIFGDNYSHVNPTVIVKTRGRDSDCGVIVKCLNEKRHWDNYVNKPIDIDFDKKIGFVIWRGVTTGRETNPGNRFDLVTSYYNKSSNIDVGFSKICETSKDKYAKYVKGQMSISKMLQYKYILSVEGNDKDSGVNWKLNSNSLVLMSRPRITSWLMETTLIPGGHYVLLKDDFSDLEEKLHWCEANQSKCKEIISNANEFMSQFSDEQNDQPIVHHVGTIVVCFCF